MPPVTSKIDGGGWTLVRHVPAGNKWHKATDLLTGTEAYGTPCGATCNKEWSTKFDKAKFNQFLFATGDERKWLISSKNEVTGSYYTNSPRLIYKSSINSNSYRARWYRRKELPGEDPWITLTDWSSAVAQGNILYGAGHYGGVYASKILPSYKGANVFIRMHGKLSLFLSSFIKILSQFHQYESW